MRFHVALLALLQQLFQAAAHIPQNRHIGLAVFAHLSRVDLEMDDLGAWRKGVELAGDAVVKAGTNGDQ